ncbi:MAG: hypothetical protein V4509_00420 [Patescibacteria group bacterium]
MEKQTPTQLHQEMLSRRENTQAIRQEQRESIKARDAEHEIVITEKVANLDAKATIPNKFAEMIIAKVTEQKEKITTARLERANTLRTNPVH